MNYKAYKMTISIVMAMLFYCFFHSASSWAEPTATQKAQNGSEAMPPTMALYKYKLNCSSPGAPDLVEIFLNSSHLGNMQDKPASLVTLEQRLAVSLKQGRDILYSRGYYDGKISGYINTIDAQNAEAIIKFEPGTQYKLGQSAIIIKGNLEKHADAQSPPLSLWDVGLQQGGPALADNVLDAVSVVEKTFRNRGYPFAAVSASKYTLNREQKTLNASVEVSPGPFVRMGQISNTGSANISQSYLEGLRGWKPGQPWQSELAEDYAQSLRQSGLFKEVSLEAGPPGENNTRDIVLNLANAPQRTIGGMISYDSDFGPGLNAYWENRNITGHGDKLRLDMPLRKDMQQLEASYRYPFFMNPKQDLLAKGGITHENLDQYESFYAEASAGIERRLSRRWKASLMGTVEGGYITETGASKKEYFMAGIPILASYDDTNSLLDSTRGQRLIFSVTPYTGEYHDSFNFVKTRLEGQKFIAVDKKNRFVIAMKAAWGAIWGADTYQVPTSARFYSGGGGSVRGYDYQSLGPKNTMGKAAGGSAQAETSVETRFRISENLGLAAFLDGGMVYDNADSNAYAFKDMAWGAGVGARYFTPIGPVRVDLATPLNKRPEDSNIQLYISIGQSF